MDKIKILIEAINDQSDENFRVEKHAENDEWLTLYNGDTMITEDWDYEVEARLNQIRRENGVYLD